MQRHAGFTLIEVMVALVIVGILAALTFPSLQRYVVRAKRTQAQATLFLLMQQEERFYTQNNRYLEFSSSSTDPQEKRFRWWSGETASQSAYEMRALACLDEPITQCVRISAIPGTENVDRHFKDADCETLTLGSAGQRTVSGPSARCWP